jgi:hypothetical protein
LKGGELKAEIAPVNPRPDTLQVRVWASLLAGEARGPAWTRDFYVCPAEVANLAHQIDSIGGGLIGLVGTQGIGKSSALMALYRGLPGTLCPENDKVFFKWRSGQALYEAFLDLKDDSRRSFLTTYLSKLVEELYTRYSKLNAQDKEELSRFEQGVQYFVQHPSVPYVPPGEYAWAERRLGRGTASEVRRQVWLGMIEYKQVILIDTPDYSKTDKRRMDRDLDEIYWLWNRLVSDGCATILVVAIQREMFRGHFFLDKMQKVELYPIPPEAMTSVYTKRFKTTEPFTEEALLALARKSRGVFRRFLRYITLTLDLWEGEHKAAGDRIGVEVVKRAVTAERLAEDMELELSALFPKHSDLRFQAVQLLTHLEEQGPQRQRELAEFLGIEAYSLSRLLTKLERGRYVTRTREATDKIVSLRKQA